MLIARLYQRHRFGGSHCGIWVATGCELRVDQGAAYGRTHGGKEAHKPFSQRCVPGDRSKQTPIRGTASGLTDLCHLAHSSGTMSAPSFPYEGRQWVLDDRVSFETIEGVTFENDKHEFLAQTTDC